MFQVLVIDPIIWLHGVLSDDLSIEQLKKRHSSHSRNKIITDIFFKSGYIETWGSGESKVFESCRKADCSNLKLRKLKAVLYVKEQGNITNAKYQEIN